MNFTLSTIRRFGGSVYSTDSRTRRLVAERIRKTTMIRELPVKLIGSAEVPITIFIIIRSKGIRCLRTIGVKEGCAHSSTLLPSDIPLNKLS